MLTLTKRQNNKQVSEVIMYLQDGTMPYCLECKYWREANSEEEFGDIMWGYTETGILTCVGILDDGEVMCNCFAKKDGLL
jgi:hypothetical protein